MLRWGEAPSIFTVSPIDHEVGNRDVGNADCLLRLMRGKAGRHGGVLTRRTRAVVYPSFRRSPALRWFDLLQQLAAPPDGAVANAGRLPHHLFVVRLLRVGRERLGFVRPTRPDVRSPDNGGRPVTWVAK